LLVNGELVRRICTKGLMAKGVDATKVSTSLTICGEITGKMLVHTCFQMLLT
jgi:hypothetical protein